MRKMSVVCRNLYESIFKNVYLVRVISKMYYNKMKQFSFVEEIVLRWWEIFM